uniref:Uncharacterized protein TCIL3000_11_7720 n=1 Tax=Trypanosoma congolense (strain IL3000) TaxID=1068625 RepID=G0V112_TRYCI|nr:unnamed protein product [Trypanosoma congolense IL3000]
MKVPLSSRGSMSSLITRVANAMGEIAPLHLAERSWDNVGILVESPASNNSGVVVLTIDLTPEVMEECLRQNAEVIVAYHPPIFSSFKRLSLADPKQNMVLQTIRHGASIYSPHTALDAAVGGINDWLASIVDGTGRCHPIRASEYAAKDDNSPNSILSYSAAGVGRVVLMNEPKTMEALVQDIKQGLGLPTVRVSLPSGWTERKIVQRVAICAGSGGSVFSLLKESVDVLLSGEMGHHDVLAANAKGQAVVLCEHSNTERGYLSRVLLHKLQQALGDGVQVVVSTADKEPLVVW